MASGNARKMELGSGIPGSSPILDPGEWGDKFLLPDEVEAINTVLREEYPYTIMGEASATFRKRLLEYTSKEYALPILTPSQKDISPLPEQLGEMHAQSRRMNSLYFHLAGTSGDGGMASLAALQGHAMWSWNATDEQLFTTEILTRLISAVGVDYFILSSNGITISPLSFAFAALTPGAQHSEFMAKAWSIIREMGRRLSGGHTNDERVMERLELSIMRLCAYELHLAIPPEKGTERSVFHRGRRHKMEETWRALIMMFYGSSLDRLREQWLDQPGAAFLHAVIGGTEGPSAILQHILGNYTGEVAGEQWNNVVKGARFLLEIHHGRNALDDSFDPLVMASAASRSTAMAETLGIPSLLPTELLLSIPTLDVAKIGEFYKVMEEYNFEWAMASFDWSEGAEPREK